jgi:hypothetical protein
MMAEMGVPGNLHTGMATISVGHISLTFLHSPSRFLQDSVYRFIILNSSFGPQRFATWPSFPPLFNPFYSPSLQSNMYYVTYTLSIFAEHRHYVEKDLL